MQYSYQHNSNTNLIITILLNTGAVAFKLRLRRPLLFDGSAGAERNRAYSGPREGFTDLESRDLTV